MSEILFQSGWLTFLIGAALGVLVSVPVLLTFRSFKKYSDVNTRPHRFILISNALVMGVGTLYFLVAYGFLQSDMPPLRAAEWTAINSWLSALRQQPLIQMSAGLFGTVIYLLVIVAYIQNRGESVRRMDDLKWYDPPIKR